MKKIIFVLLAASLLSCGEERRNEELNDVDLEKYNSEDEIDTSINSTPLGTFSNDSIADSTTLDSLAENASDMTSTDTVGGGQEEAQ